MALTGSERGAIAFLERIDAAVVAVEDQADESNSRGHQPFRLHGLGKGPLCQPAVGRGILEEKAVKLQLSRRAVSRHAELIGPLVVGTEVLRCALFELHLHFHCCAAKTHRGRYKTLLRREVHARIERTLPLVEQDAIGLKCHIHGQNRYTVGGRSTAETLADGVDLSCDGMGPSLTAGCQPDSEDGEGQPHPQ